MSTNLQVGDRLAYRKTSKYDLPVEVADMYVGSDNSTMVTLDIYVIGCGWSRYGFPLPEVAKNFLIIETNLNEILHEDD